MDDRQKNRLSMTGFARQALIVLVAFLAISRHTAADEKSNYSAVHLAEAERLVYALGVTESLSIPTKQAIEDIRKTHPERAELMQTVTDPYTERQYVGRELRGFMAEHFSIEVCRELSRFWEGPVGRKFVNVQVRVLTNGNAPALNFTPAEQEIRKRFEQTEAYRQFVRVHPLMQKRFAEFIRQTKEKMAHDMKQEIERRSKLPDKN
jgi:hypothetical protein